MSIEINALRRTYQRGRGWRRSGADVVALHDLSLDVPTGEVHGLLGPNGAGKTTLCKILSTVLLPSSGTAEVHGFDVATEPAGVRPLIGIVFGGERGLYLRLSARQNLRYWAAMYKLPQRRARARIDELLDRFGLSSRADDRVETLSRGMKQRLHLARGLINDPQVILFDEPTVGMDPVAAHDFRLLISELRGEGRTILITTHNMAEAEQVCDRVTLMDKGSVLATATPRELAAMSSQHRWVEAEGPVPEVSGLPGVLRVESADGMVRVAVDGQESARLLLTYLLDHGAPVVRSVPLTLEDVYMELVGARGMEV